MTEAFENGTKDIKALEMRLWLIRYLIMNPGTVIEVLRFFIEVLRQKKP